MSKSGIEMRQHIRVNDYAVFKYFEPGSNIDASEQALAENFFAESNGRYYFLCKEWKALDDGLNLAISQLPMYEALSKKMDLLKEAIYPSVAGARHLINLSDGGVGFNGDLEVKTDNSWGYVMLILDNWPLPLFIKGQFVYCIPTKDQEYAFKIGFKFDQASLDCADIIKEQVQRKLAEKANNY